MGRYRILVLCLFMAPLVWAQQVTETPWGVRDPSSPVRIRVYDYAHVPRSILDQAERETTQIFSEAKVRVMWLGCRIPVEGSKGDSNCHAPFSPLDLILRILSPSMEARFPFTDTTLGFALPSTDGDGGDVANAFYDRIQNLAAGADPSIQHVLALVSAHEIGHLLLPLDGHAGEGIMCAEWKLEDLRFARRGYFLFTPRQSKLINANLLHRIGQRANRDPLLLLGAGREMAPPVKWPDSRDDHPSDSVQIRQQAWNQQP